MCQVNRPNKNSRRGLSLSLLKTNKKQGNKNNNITRTNNKKNKKLNIVRRILSLAKRARLMSLSTIEPNYQSSHKKEPTVVDLLTMIGECKKSRTKLNNDKLAMYSNRDMMKISSKWSKTVLKNDKTDELDVDMLIGSLSKECASLEVEAISMLASMEHSNEKENINEIDMSIINDLDLIEDNADDMDDDLWMLEAAGELLSKELAEIEAIEKKMFECENENEYRYVNIEVSEINRICACSA